MVHENPEDAPALAEEPTPEEEPTPHDRPSLADDAQLTLGWSQDLFPLFMRRNQRKLDQQKAAEERKCLMAEQESRTLEQQKAAGGRRRSLAEEGKPLNLTPESFQTETPLLEQDLRKKDNGMENQANGESQESSQNTNTSGEAEPEPEPEAGQTPNSIDVNEEDAYETLMRMELEARRHRKEKQEIKKQKDDETRAALAQARKGKREATEGNALASTGSGTAEKGDELVAEEPVSIKEMEVYQFARMTILFYRWLRMAIQRSGFNNMLSLASSHAQLHSLGIALAKWLDKALMFGVRQRCSALLC